jgi:apolipoprotein N-acyltransferase
LNRLLETKDRKDCVMYDPALPRTRVFLPAMLSGLLLYLCFFPVNSGFLGWIALVPVLTLVRANARPRRIYFAAFVGGLVCYVPAISWMRVAHPAMYASWLFLAVCCALFLAMSIWLARRLDRLGVPFWLAVPCGFVAVEYFRSHFPTGYTWLEWVGLRRPIGFGWYMLGHTQHEWSSVIQVSDITGVYGVSFLVALVNAAVLLSVERITKVRCWLRDMRPMPASSTRPAVVAALVLLAVIIYGNVRLGHDSYPDGPQVALIQGNIPQDVKNEHGAEMADHFIELADKAAHPAKGEPKPDLIVWPETSFVSPWFDVGPGVDVRALFERYKKASDADTMTPEQGRYKNFLRGYNTCPQVLAKAGERWRTATLYGLNTFQWEADDREWRYNSAVLADQNGKYVARYDKIHLVPFGEYVPAGETLPFMKMFTPYEGDYSCKPGEMWTRFPHAVDDQTYHFACLICYEDSDATLARQYVRPSAEGVDFFVNISNDGWFDGTAEHEQHLAICRFRAIETRRSVVRAVNMGISAIIDPDGEIVALPGATWVESKKVAGIVRGKVPIGSGTTLYARLGDWLPLVCWAVILFGGLVRWVLARRRA